MRALAFFPVAGLEINLMIPLMAGFFASLLLGQIGLTGGIVTLPFMISFLGYTAPGVSATNLVYTIVTSISGLFSYNRKKRLLWRLGMTAGIGGLLGASMGPLIRSGLLGDVTLFKVFFGIMLTLSSLRIMIRKYPKIEIGSIDKTGGNLREQNFSFNQDIYSYSSIYILVAGALAGMVSTTFGIGTGLILVPFYTTVLKLPIYAVASSALLSTLIISSVGVMTYSSHLIGGSHPPDIALGLLFGLGGVIGGYTSPMLQIRFSNRALHRILGGVLGFWGFFYIIQGI